jgi:hypothetical protein
MTLNNQGSSSRQFSNKKKHQDSSQTIPVRNKIWRALGRLRREEPFADIENFLRHEILPSLAIIAWGYALDSEELFVEVGEIVKPRA